MKKLNISSRECGRESCPQPSSPSFWAELPAQGRAPLHGTLPIIGPNALPINPGLPNTSEKPWTSKEKVQNIKIGVGGKEAKCFDLLHS